MGRERYEFKLPRLVLVDYDEPVKGNWGEQGALYEVVWPKLAPSWVLEAEKFELVKLRNAQVVVGDGMHLVLDTLRARAIAAEQDPVISAPSETMQRDELYGAIVGGHVYAYFGLLAEYVLDLPKDIPMSLWADLAGIAFWTGRTGSAVVDHMATDRMATRVRRSGEFFADRLKREHPALAQVRLEFLQEHHDLPKRPRRRRRRKTS